MNSFRKIAFLGDYVPRQCGIATFTHDLCAAIAEQHQPCDYLVVAVDDMEAVYDYPDEVRFEIAEKVLSSYQRATDYLNFNNIDVVSLQHEFGIYGGIDGSHVLGLLRDLRMPIVTTLHTILDQPTPGQKRVMEELLTLSSRIVSMTARGRRILIDGYCVPEEKIDIVPHGIPDMPFVDPSFYKDQFGVEGKCVILTFGLLSPTKGIEHVLEALPQTIAENPNVVYVVLGATHPAVLSQQGESYRMKLERLAHDLGIEEHVIFYNRYVEPEELKEFIGAADIYITPYLNRAQITSGTLSYSFGCGKAVVSTPYWHAEELLADGRGILVPFADPKAITTALIGLLRDESHRHAMRKRAYMLGRQMVWSNIAHSYLEVFEKARSTRSAMPSRSHAVKTLDKQDRQLPIICLDHLVRMSDTTGILQHAFFSIPRFGDGYCTDDNARALLLTILLEEIGFETAQFLPLRERYAAFLTHAFDAQSGRFRNLLTFDRQWTEEAGSEDSHSRALWALGTCVGRSMQKDFQTWGAQLFEQALPAIAYFSSPRAIAFGLIGIHEYLKRLRGDRLATQIRDSLTARLLDLYGEVSSDDWKWFENIVTYDNEKICHALILSGRWTSNETALDVGTQSLMWLLDMQTTQEGWFRPIGSNGWYPRGGTRAEFDQQPIMAHSAVSACIEAYQASQDSFWLDKARVVFEWFLGRNDLRVAIYDPNTGGCRDGLHVDRLNQNEGAESTLAWLLALAEMHAVEQSLNVFKDSPDHESDIS